MDRPTLSNLPPTDIDNDILILLDYLQPYYPTHPPSPPSQRVRAAIRKCLKDEPTQTSFIHLYTNTIGVEFRRHFCHQSTFCAYYEMLVHITEYYEAKVASLRLSDSCSALFRRKLNALFHHHLITRPSDFLSLLRAFLRESLFHNTKVVDAISLLHGIGLAEEVDPIIVELSIEKIKHFIARHCWGVWDKPLLQQVYAHIHKNIYPTLSFLDQSYLYELYKIARDELVALRTGEIYDMVQMFPESRMGLGDLYECLEKKNEAQTHETHETRLAKLSGFHLEKRGENGSDHLARSGENGSDHLAKLSGENGSGNYLAKLSGENGSGNHLASLSGESESGLSHFAPLSGISQSKAGLSHFAPLSGISLSESGLSHFAPLSGIDQRTLLVTTFISQCRKHLLHAGANTIDVISTYTKTLKAFLIVDPRGVLLDKVVRPIRLYLKTRDDIVVKLVHGLLDEDRSNQLAELVVELRNSNKPPQIEVPDLNWYPDPIDALPDFKKGRIDIIESLVSIFDSRDVFINEFTKLFAERLIRCDYNTCEIEAQLSLLKARFGKNEFGVLDVMLSDIDESRRLQMKRGFLHSAVLSHLYWSSVVESDSFVFPKSVQALFDEVNRDYARVKKGRSLKPIVGMGSVTLEIGEKRRVFTVTPEKAAIIALFDGRDGLGVEEVARTLGMMEYVARGGLEWWVGEGVLKREGERYVEQ